MLGRVAPASPSPVQPDNDNSDAADYGPDAKLFAQAERAGNLQAFANDSAGAVIPSHLRSRTALLDARARLLDAGDPAGAARLNSVLSAEAFARAARVTVRWLDRRDARTGLFPHTLSPKDRYWSYGDAGSDLFPFLAIATRYLVPGRYPEILETLAAERRLNPGFPQDLMLEPLRVRARRPEEQMLSNVEYAKDGLLPMVELLGPDPWLGRLREVVDAVLDAAAVPTPMGAVPSDAAEVNGSLLQVLARLSWADPDPRRLAMGRRIAAAYLDHALPATGWIPPQRWDFVAGEPIEESVLHLGDHGSEIVSGLIEWHRVEERLGLPERGAHRDAIGGMLDRLLATGRTPSGLWYDGIAFPGGRVSDRALNDNWGYLGQAYLNQARTLRAAGEGGDAADRYEEAVRRMLRGAIAVDYFKWEDGDMDGYADALEGALSLLRYLEDPAAGRWVDRQMPVLYGFQREAGGVTDENIDGNFIRTVLLYGLSLTQGARIEPWASEVAVGAASDGACLHVHLHAARPWSGRLVFDTPRHAEHLALEADYPRLNAWPEWWAVSADARYAATLADGSDADVDGASLAAGLQLTLEPGREYRLRVCRS